jgi:hypothetical protein
MRGGFVSDGRCQIHNATLADLIRMVERKPAEN